MKVVACNTSCVYCKMRENFIFFPRTKEQEELCSWRMNLVNFGRIYGNWSFNRNFGLDVFRASHDRFIGFLRCNIGNKNEEHYWWLTGGKSHKRLS